MSVRKIIDVMGARIGAIYLMVAIKIPSKSLIT